MSKNNTKIDEMFKAGAHFGYSKTRRHPSISKMLFGSKNKNDIIDLEKTNAMLESAKEFMAKLSSESKQIIIVGAKPEARNEVLTTALAMDASYVVSRWVGGTLTNFPEIKKRINRLVDLKDARLKGELATKYTKKEQLLISREIERMEKLFSGLVNLRKADALLVIDAKREHIAVSEANKVGIPVIALVNSDTNIKNIEYPILANDASISSIKFFLGELKSAWEDGKVKVKAE